MGALAVVIMMIAYLATFSLSTWSQQKAVTFEYLQTTAEVESRALDAFFRHSEQSLQQLRDRIFDADGQLINKPKAYDALQRALHGEPDWRLASITDLDGKIEMTTSVPLGAPLPEISASSRAGWASGLNELRLGVAMSIGRAVESSVTHEWVMPLRFGVRDRKGNLTYLLVAAMPLDRPLSFWNGMRLPPDGAVAILHVDNAIYLLARNPLPPAVTAAEAYGTPRLGDFAQMLLAGKLPSSGTYEAVQTLTGSAELWGHARLYDYPLVFDIQSPRALLWQRWWASVWLTYLIFGVLLVGAYAVYRWIVARQLAFYRDTVAAEARLRASQSDLQRSREKLVLAQKIARVGSFEHDTITGEIEWSDEMYEILGLDKATNVAGVETLLKVVHPEDRARLNEYRASEIDSKPTPDAETSIEYRIIRPDGVERIVRRERYVLYDETGKPVRRYGTLQDITEQKTTEIELQHRSEALARAQRLAMIGSIEYDILTGKYECSDETYRIFGIAKTIPLNFETFLHYIHPEDRALVVAYRERELAGQPVAAFEFRITRPDGGERIIRRESDVVRDEAGRPIRRCGTLQDVTDQKKTEIELRRNRENLAHAQHLAGMGSFERDMITGRIEWSDEMYEILGIEKTDEPPSFETMLQFIHPEDRTRVAAQRSREIAGQPIEPEEHRIIRADGVERIVRRWGEVIYDATGRPLRRYGTMQDVTTLRLAERRKIELERQLLHSQKLEALGTLAGGIAHDLNNALVPILALSKLTARQVAPDSKARENLETIFRASEHARDLVKRVLAFSRKDASEMRETRLDEVVAEALKLLRSTIPSSIQLDARIAEVAPIPADPSGIQQIVTNLVTNAVGAIGDRPGKITVALAMAEGGASQRELCLSVADNGKGMDEATSARIFEPFFTTKQVGEGTGLGLSIVHGIVAAHGGRIEVESAPGQGTRFTIHFPARETEAEAAA